MWVVLANKVHLANIPKVLLLYRTHPKQTGVYYSKEQLIYTNKIRRDILRLLSVKPNKKEFYLHQKAALWNPVKDSELLELKHWFIKLLNANEKKLYYKHLLFKQLIAERWVGLCLLNKRFNFKRIKISFSINELVPYILYSTLSIYVRKLKRLLV